MDYRNQRNETLALWRKAIAECEGIVTTRTVQEFAALVAAAESERWQALRDHIKSDLDRPEGRWGIHGHTAVDDDYFGALEWVLERMDEALGA